MAESGVIMGQAVFVSRSASERAYKGETSYNNPFVPTKTLKKFNDLGYSVAVEKKGNKTVISLEDRHGESGYIFEDANSDMARADYIKKQNAEHLKDINKTLAWELKNTTEEEVERRRRWKADELKGIELRKRYNRK